MFKNKFIFQYIFLFIMALSLSACFEIREKIIIRDDGSGSYKLTLDFSESRDQLSKVVANHTYPPMSVIDSAMYSNAQAFETLEGIFNAESFTNHEHFNYGLQFEFVNTEALSAALAFAEGVDEKDLPKPYYEWVGRRKFKRNGIFNLKIFTDKLDPLSPTLNSSPMYVRQYIDTIYNNVTYEWILDSDSRIKKTPSGMQLSDNHKRLIYKLPLKEVLEDENTLKCLIKLQ